MPGPDLAAVRVSDEHSSRAVSMRGRQWGRRLPVLLPASTLLVILFLCFVWPSIYPVPNPIGGSVLAADLPLLTPGHFLGTDTNGNDNWSRILHGGRTSLQIAIIVNAVGFLLGAFLGAFGAYIGGVVDSVIMRLVDVVVAFPSLIWLVAIAQVFGPSYASTIWALMFFSVPAFARVARSATLRLRGLPFIAAAQLSGTPPMQVLFRHIAPNIFAQLATFALLGTGIVIILEGGLSFLGLGIQPPEPSWGNMIYHGQQSLFSRPVLLLLPSSALFLTVLSLNVLGETLRLRWAPR
jgi:peptide/nickel transport system permease protein